MLCHAGFGADVLWTITRDGVAIEKTRPFGRPNHRFIRREDISGIHVDRDKANATRFHLSLHLISGIV